MCRCKGRRQLSLGGGRRQVTSSMALSPPPMTASGFLRNIGAAPSHTAQAEMPLFQKPFSSPEPLNCSFFATAPASHRFAKLGQLVTALA